MIPIKYTVRSLWVRRATTLATALGIGLVVFVLAAALMLSAGVRKTTAVAGRDDTGLVMRKGSDSEMSSALEDPQVSLVRAAPGVAKDAQGNGVAAGEVIVVTATEKVGASGFSNMVLRGVSPGSEAFRPALKVVRGRPAKPGTDEAIVGRGIVGRFKGVELGQRFEIKKNRFVEIVGVFEDDGSSYESELWADFDTVRTAFGRQGGLSSIRVKLESKTKFDAFKASIESDKRLGLMAQRENEFMEKQSEGTSIFISALGILVSVFFSIGAMIGAMNTMYAAVSSRKREIGVLRALGFSRIAILTAFVLESSLLSLIGGLIGTALSLALSGTRISMMNFQSFSELVFKFDATPDTLIVALVFALGMGFLGGFWPALRAARTPAVVAMRGA